MLIWRQYAPLVFLNARNLSTQLRVLVQQRKDIRVVVLDATAASGIDTSAISAFTTAQDDLATAGVALWVVNVREVAWHRIVAKLEIAGKPIPPRLDSLADAVARFEEFGTAEPGSNG
jgi:MFS superfamily sulfate permease-like transporter